MLLHIAGRETAGAGWVLQLQYAKKVRSGRSQSGAEWALQLRLVEKVRGWDEPARCRMGVIAPIGEKGEEIGGAS